MGILNFTHKYFTKLHSKINVRILCIFTFAFNYTWLLSFPFEGPLFYFVSDSNSQFVNISVLYLVLAHLVGLLAGALFCFNLSQTYWLNILFSLSTITITTLLILFDFNIIQYGLVAVTCFSGIVLASWANYLKHLSYSNSRATLIADWLIASNCGLIVISIIAYSISLYVGLISCIILLVLGLICAFFLPTKPPKSIDTPTHNSITKLSLYTIILKLCCFIFLVSITAGLYYHVIAPSFSDFAWLTSWYFALPYIISIFIVRKLFNAELTTFLLYASVALIGFAFIGFTLLDRSVISYTIIITLLMFAYGIFDFFWWSTLGKLFDYEKNPPKFFGIGLACNVAGILVGGIIGNTITSQPQLEQYAIIISFSSICLIFIALPSLHQHLSTLLMQHSYLTELTSQPSREIEKAIVKCTESIQFTKREQEILTELFKGKTYKNIATKLSISENTVKTHVKNIYAKAKVQSRAELIYSSSTLI